jgi:hypothetical protein
MFVPAHYMRVMWQKGCLLVPGVEFSDQRRTMTESKDICRKTFSFPQGDILQQALLGRRIFLSLALSSPLTAKL